MEEAHELAVGEDLTKKKTFVLADELYYVFWTQNDARMALNVFCLIDIADTAKKLVDLIKKEANRPRFCNAFQFSLWFKASSSKQRETRDSTKKASGYNGSGSEERESAEMQMTFEIKNSALQHFYAVRNHQKPAAGKRAAHTFVVDISVHLCRSVVSCKELRCHTNYGTHGIIGTNHLRGSTVTENIFHVPPEKRLFCGSAKAFGKVGAAEPGAGVRRMYGGPCV